MTTFETPVPPVPPVWAESLLRTLLTRDDRETVSGDLLEEYRESVYPASGRTSADRWYVAQVLGFLWRSTWAWAALLWAATLGRFLLDAFAPVTNFALRAGVTTWTHITIALLAGFWSAWRTRRALSGTLVAGTAQLIAAAADVVGVAGVLALRHDAATLAAIQQSGGLGEALLLPPMLTPFVALIGTCGGLIGKSGARLTRLKRA